MPLDIDAELARLRDMTVPELREEYRRAWGEETRSHSKPHLVKRVIWRLQAAAEGWTGYPPEVLERARALADLSFLRTRPPKGYLDGDAALAPTRALTASINQHRDPRLPMVGATLVRRYKGRDVRVQVTANGFEVDGRLFRTLSAAARHITGTHLSGYRFFNLGQKRAS